MWFDFGIGEKKKPVVRIFDSSVVFSDDVDVLDLREVAFQARPGGVFKVAAPPQDTIESLINRLIELGEPKPEVVINGEKWEGGKELYKATIDELHVLESTTTSAYGYSRTTYELGSHEQSSCATEFGSTWCYNGFNTLADCEKAIISILKDRLSRVVTETTTITY